MVRLGSALLTGRDVAAAPAATPEQTEDAFTRWSAGVAFAPRGRRTQLEQDFFDWVVARGKSTPGFVARVAWGDHRDEDGRRVDPRHWIGAFVANPQRYSAKDHEDFLIFAQNQAPSRKRQSGAEVALEASAGVVGGALSGAHDTVVSPPDAPREMIEGVGAIRSAQVASQAARAAFRAHEIDEDALRAAERAAWEDQTEAALRLAETLPGSAAAGEALRGLSADAQEILRRAQSALRGG